MSRTDAPPQLERVLAMIPWLTTHRNVAKRDVADRFMCHSTSSNLTSA